MLLNLCTGLKPSMAVMKILMWHGLGFADDSEVFHALEKIRRQQKKARAKKIAM